MAARAYNCLQRHLRAGSDNQIRLSTDQFRRADKRAARIVDGPKFDDDVLSFTKAMLFQLRTKGFVITNLRLNSDVWTEKRHSRNFASLLCMSSKRPCHRAAEKRHEIAPLHVPLPSSGHGILAAHNRTSIGAEVGIKIVTAVHGRCPLWVKSGHGA